MLRGPGSLDAWMSRRVTPRTWLEDRGICEMHSFVSCVQTFIPSGWALVGLGGTLIWIQWFVVVG